MYKLLTEEEKKKVAREYGRRRLAVMLSLLAALLLISLVGMLPSYVLSRTRHSEVVKQVEIIADVGLSGEGAELEKWLSGLKRKIAVLNPELDKDRPTELMEEVLLERPSGIELTSLAWIKNGSEAALSVSGVARDRQALISFENGLAASGQFSDVVFPVSNLAKDRNISFKVQLKSQAK